MKVFQQAKVGKYTFGIILDEEKKEAYEAIQKEDEQWEIEFSYVFLPGVSSSEVAEALDFDAVKEMGYLLWRNH